MVRALGIAVAIAALTSSVALANGDAANGKTVFNRCAMCHSNTKGAPNRIGPNLFGVYGRKAGTLPGFSYSAALKNSGIIWNDESLKKWVAGPGKFVPGNRMTFAGLASAQQQDDMVAYLKTLK